MSAAHDVGALLAQLASSAASSASSRKLRLALPEEAPAPLSLAWPGLGDVLPDGGMPRGVVELSAPRALGGSTSVALAAARAGQARGPSAWCAWLDPEATLYAPGVVASGVDLARMLVVRPPRSQLGRVALKLVGSGAFEVVVIDFDPVPGARAESTGEAPPRTPPRIRAWAPEVLVRKLALAAEPGGTTVLLLTDSSRPRAAPWPVALRLDLTRPSRSQLTVRIGKDRRGRVGLAKSVPFYPVTRAAG
jgi:recombination protein RecA